MQVFKFGGASVKDAESIKNVATILKRFNELDKTVVISAMGKSTNALEEVVKLYIKKDKKYLEYLHEIREYHAFVSDELFGIGSNVEYKLFALFDRVEYFCTSNISVNHTFIYDQIISVGELASSLLISEYLKHIGMENQWIDAREIIRTDHAYTDAQVLWNKTSKLVQKKYSSIKCKTSITQGFIGSTSERFTTTLGREGSDFTAAILAYCLDAEKMIIWKDVEGVMNADPKQFPDAILLRKIAFKEAVEMTYYGAKVIHPKTIRPLQNKNIPLEVRSFIKSDDGGTLIHTFEEDIEYPPIIVKMQDQVWLNFSAKDFSFISENHMQEIFGAFIEVRLSMNIMQNGAISFAAAVDNKPEKIAEIEKLLSEHFTIKSTGQLDLITIRHYNEAILKSEFSSKVIWLTQKTSETIQVLCKV